MMRKSGDRFSLDKREAFVRRSCSNKEIYRMLPTTDAACGGVVDGVLAIAVSVR
jgi:hypothetical protein